MPSEAMTPSFSWSERAAEQLRNLVDRPWLLLVILLAANAVASPYAHVTHDARLYSAQVINEAENGVFNNDLFFRYGSQDNFSLFSRLLAPLVKTIGFDWAFFIVYLAATIALLAGFMRLVGRIIEDRLIVLICLLYMAVAPLVYGGHAVLRVHETFLTARLVAGAVTVFGLDYLLQARYGLSLAFLAAAGLIHPLMAVGGLFLWAGVFMVDKLGWKRSTLFAGGLALVGIVVLAIPPLGHRFLGSMDEEWCAAIRNGCAFTFPSEWEAGDWINTVLCLLWVGVGAVYYRQHNPGRACFFAILLMLGLAATLGNVLAFNLPYALLMQGQPFRALWILKVFEVPLGFMLTFKLWRSGFFAQQTLALILLGLFVSAVPVREECYAFLAMLPMCVVYLRGLAVQPRTPGWMIKSVAASLILSRFAWMLYVESVCFRLDGELLRHIDLSDVVRVHLEVFGIVAWMIVFLALLLCFTRIGRERALGITCVCIFAAVQTCSLIVPDTAYVREHGRCYFPDIQYARNFLQSRQSPRGKRLTVYSAYGRIEYVWLEFKANNYFDWWMTGGFIFQRPMAIEGQRRAVVAAPFEVARFRSIDSFLNDRTKLAIKRFFRRDLYSPAPTLDDLATLCHEPELDYAVLKQKFGNLYEATNGSVYIYDCRHVRAALKMPVDAHGAVAGLTPPNLPGAFAKTVGQASPSRTEVISP